VKLVQMPRDLLHLEDADLDRADLDPGLLAAFRAYLPRVLDERRGLAILAPSAAGTCLLMVLARRIGVAMRDANIHLRDSGGDIKVGKQQLCYLPGHLLDDALVNPDTRAALAREAACFVQDLDGAWSGADERTLPPDALLDLLDERLAAGRPTFLNAVADRLPPVVEAAIRARLDVLELA
jgi:hypothetical protein